METIIKFVLGNFPIICLSLAFIFSWAFRKNQSFAEALTRYTLLLPIGLGGIWGFYYHAFYPKMAAEVIGWADSPFQFEVAVANLGMGLVGVVGFWRSLDFALAAALMVSCFLWGAAFGHIQEIVTLGNFAHGNAGSILYSDILIPSVLWIGYFLWNKK